MIQQLLARKSVDDLRSDAESHSGLKRTLGAFDLIMLGIGAIIGTGIFVLLGKAAADHAGPAISVSFVLAAFASVFAGLCYAEMASMIPIAGSAYTYSYATMGQLVAWIIGWDLILEYLIGAATVSVGWSGYVCAFLQNICHINLPPALIKAPIEWDDATHAFHATGTIINMPAVLIVLALTTILVLGIRESVRFNAVIVAIKVAVVLLFIAFVTPFVRTSNWDPFLPPNTGTFGQFGPSGVLKGAMVVFFAYIGFDAVSTAAQECKRPQRDLPIGILGSLAICTVLYIAMSLVLTGAVPFEELHDVAHPVAFGAHKLGLTTLEVLIEIGAIAGLSSVMLVMLLGQPRIFFSMARDGLFPAFATRVHPRFGTPYVTTIICGVFAAIAGGLLPLGWLGEMTSIGTLFAFVLVSLGVMILRMRRPDIPRAFRVPGGTYVVPLLGAGLSALLMAGAGTMTLMRLVIWLVIGLLIYAFYGYWHAAVRAGGPGREPSRT